MGGVHGECSVPTEVWFFTTAVFYSRFGGGLGYVLVARVWVGSVVGSIVSSGGVVPFLPYCGEASRLRRAGIDSLGAMCKYGKCTICSCVRGRVFHAKGRSLC